MYNCTEPGSKAGKAAAPGVFAGSVQLTTGRAAGCGRVRPGVINGIGQFSGAKLQQCRDKLAAIDDDLLVDQGLILESFFLNVWLADDRTEATVK